MKKYVVIFYFTFVGIASCARILGIVSMPSYSHQVVFRPLWKELSLRGHQVTVMTTDPMKDPALTNLTEIDWHATYEIFAKHDLVGYLAEYKLQIWKIFDKFNKVAYDLLEYQMNHPEVKKIFEDKDTKFDIVLMEMFSPPHTAFSIRFNCPYIGLTSLDASTYLHDLMGNPIHPSMYTDFMLPFEGKLNFFERLGSFIYQQIFRLIALPLIPHQNILIEKYFGDGMPPIEDLMQNMSLLFINVNPALHGLRPVTPATVVIGGGTHIVAPKPLPKVIITSLLASSVFLRIFLHVN